MLFKPFLCEKIIQGEKTQTRRLVKPGDQFFPKHGIVYRRSRILYQVSRTYAVQTGRGKKAVARIRLLKIRQEFLREITFREMDREAEGLPGHSDFYAIWNMLHPSKGERWENNPLVYVLTFEKVEEE